MPGGVFHEQPVSVECNAIGRRQIIDSHCKHEFIQNICKFSCKSMGLGGFSMVHSTITSVRPETKVTVIPAHEPMDG